MDEFENPAKKIRFLLHTHSMVLQDLAEELGLTKEALREIIDEEAKPTPNILKKVCRFFNLKDDYFGPLPEPATAGAATTQIYTVRKGGGAAQSQPKKRRKIDLAEMAARHQALLECLVAKKLVDTADYQKRLAAIRARIAERQKAR